MTMAFVPCSRSITSRGVLVFRHFPSGSEKLAQLHRQCNGHLARCLTMKTMRRICTTKTSILSSFIVDPYYRRHLTSNYFANNKRHVNLDCNTRPHSDLNSRFVKKNNIIDGKSIAKEIRREIKAEMDILVASDPTQRKPHLSVVLVGNDLASIVYVRNKVKAASEIGVSCDILRMPDTVTEQEVLEELDVLNSDSTVDGLIVQLPLPDHINERLICDSILPDKDVDGFNVLNVGRFCVDEKAFIPATPLGVLEILKYLEIETCGKNAVVVGRSKNVGLPIALHLQAERNGDCSAGNATTTICHSHTPPDQLMRHTQGADIIISATGVPGLIKADMVKDGVVIIDIGIVRMEQPNGKFRLVGDVEFEEVKKKASLITPVPGGVGPVTVAMLLKNTLTAYKKDIDFRRRSSGSGSSGCGQVSLPVS